MDDISQKIDDNRKISIGQWFKEFDVPKYLAFIAVFLFSLTIFFVIYDFVRYSKDVENAPKVWYGILDRFTNQSNIFILIFVIFYVFYPKHSFLKGDGLLITCMVFIFFTFFGYNVILVGISGYGYHMKEGIVPLLGNICLHVLFPIYFIVFGFVHMYFRPFQEPKRFWKLLLLGMIYPTIYVIYIIAIPYIYKAYETLNNGESYSVYGSATNVKKSPMAWVYILVMYLVFFPGSFAIFYYSWKGLNKLNKNKKIDN